MSHSSTFPPIKQLRFINKKYFKNCCPLMTCQNIPLLTNSASALTPMPSMLPSNSMPPSNTKFSWFITTNTHQNKLSVYVCEISFWRLEPWPLPLHLTSIYTCRVTTALRMHGDHKYPPLNTKFYSLDSLIRVERKSSLASFISLPLQSPRRLGWLHGPRHL